MDGVASNADVSSGHAGRLSSVPHVPRAPPPAFPMTRTAPNFYAENSFVVVRTGRDEAAAFDALTQALPDRLPNEPDVSSADSEGWTYILTVETDPWFRVWSQAPTA